MFIKQKTPCVHHEYVSRAGQYIRIKNSGPDSRADMQSGSDTKPHPSLALGACWMAKLVQPISGVDSLADPGE